jgi:hypothetical protein
VRDHFLSVAGEHPQAHLVVLLIVLEHEDDDLGEGIEVPFRQPGPDLARERGIRDQVAEAHAMQAEVLTQAAQDDGVRAHDGLVDDTRPWTGIRVGELQEGFVDDDQIEVRQGIHERYDGIAGEETAVGIVGIADDGGARSPLPYEGHEGVRIEGEAVSFRQPEHVHALAGLLRLIRPPPEGGYRHGQAVLDQQMVDPGDEFRRAVAHRHGLWLEVEQVRQFGCDRIGGAGVVGENVPQPGRQLVEHAGGGEIGITGNAEIHDVLSAA